MFDDVHRVCIIQTVVVGNNCVKAVCSCSLPLLSPRVVGLPKVPTRGQ